MVRLASVLNINITYIFMSVIFSTEAVMSDRFSDSFTIYSTVIIM